MDGHRFDELTRIFAMSASRRGIVKGALVGIAGAALAALDAGRAGAAATKVGLCHRTGSATNQVVFLSVDDDAVPAHRAHGDAIAPDLANDPANCGGCGVRCDDGDPCTVDTCQGGQCVHIAVDCAVQQLCTIATCMGGQCVSAPVPCDDANGTLCHLPPSSPCDQFPVCIDGQCLIPCFVEHPPEHVEFCNPVSQVCTPDGCRPA
jgi:hypothetical protein